MDAHEVLETVRSGAAPSTWSVLPLRRDWLLRSVLQWAVVAVLTFALFVPALVITVPDNFTRGAVGAVITALLLVTLGAAAFGSAGVALYDLWRLSHMDDYLIVITPDDFVRAAPRGVVHVPIADIDYITVHGATPPVEQGMQDVRSMNQTNAYSRLIHAPRPRQPRQAPSLAFLDTRTNTAVIVARDAAYGDLYSMSRLLEINSEAKRRSRTS